MMMRPLGPHGYEEGEEGDEDGYMMLDFDVAGTVEQRHGGGQQYPGRKGKKKSPQKARERSSSPPRKEREQQGQGPKEAVANPLSPKKKKKKGRGAGVGGGGLAHRDAERYQDETGAQSRNGLRRHLQVGELQVARADISHFG